MPDNRSYFVDSLFDELCNVSSDDNYLIFRDMCHSINNNTNRHSLSFSSSDSNMVAYTNESGQRARTRLGRYLRRNMQEYTKRLTDSELEKFVQNVMKHSVSSNSIEILRGQDIVYAYHDGFAQESCMTGGVDAVEMYGINDNVRLLTCNHRRYKGRALLWTADDGTVIMDRIYPTDNGMQITLMRDYAKQQGWVYREDSGHTDKKRMLSDGKIYNITIQSANDKWPYMDTFIYAVGNRSLSTISNAVPNNVRQYAYLTSTSGDYYVVRLKECPNCNSLHADYNTSDAIMPDCSRMRVCHHCINHSGDFIHSHPMGCYYHKDIPKTELTYIYDNNELYEQDHFCSDMFVVKRHCMYTKTCVCCNRLYRNRINSILNYIVSSKIRHDGRFINTDTSICYYCIRQLAETPTVDASHRIYSYIW